MDESELFPGFGRPEDRRQEDGTPRSRRPNRTNPTEPTAGGPPAGAPSRPLGRMLSHADLAAPTLSHLEECPALAATASAIADRCLAAGTRFPHTLLVGPADSSKRLIAQAIARDMATSFHVIELPNLRGPDDMHAALRRVPAGAVALMSGVEALEAPAMAALSRAVVSRESVRDTRMRDMMREVELEREPWKRAEPARSPHPYADFTAIVTSRAQVAADSALHRWVELQFFTRRDSRTERPRMARALRRAGITLDASTAAEFASFATTYRIRTLQAVNMLAVHLDAACDDPARREEVFEHAMDPSQVRRIRALMRKLAS